MITDIFKFYMRLMDGSVDELVALLARAKVADRLLEYFPPGQQTEDAFKAHFEKQGMPALVRTAPLSHLCPALTPASRLSHLRHGSHACVAKRDALVAAGLPVLPASQAQPSGWMRSTR